MPNSRTDPIEHVGRRDTRILPLTLAAVTFLASFFAKEARSLTSENSSSPCQIPGVTCDGWTGEELSNKWIDLIILPQLGDRVMQVRFGGHDYLFVNPAYKGKYIPPQVGRIALHLDDDKGNDLGILGEAEVGASGKAS